MVRACAEEGASKPHLALPWLMTCRMCLSRRTSTTCKVGAGMSDDGMMHSDHRPIFVDFNI